MGRWWTPLFLVALLSVMFVWFTDMGWDGRSTAISWSELKEKVAAGQIDEVVIGEHTVRAHPLETEGEAVYEVHRVQDESFLPLLEAHGVSYRGERRSPCADGSLMFFIPLLLLVGLWALMGRQGVDARGVATFGKASASLVPEEGTGVSFDDVAGVDEAAEELREVVSFLQTPEKFTALGGRPPKGVLLVGPPGTGKTLLARAVAGEAGVPFFSISGSAFVEMFVGVGAARVRDLFKQALEHAPCIIFVDELDAVGKSRSAGAPGNEEREQTLNQLLVEMDGFDNRKGIIVMAATNRPEILDPALLRAGRFDRQVVVDRPDVRGREAILRVHARELQLDPSVDLAEIARLTPGFAGADLANVLNESALLAARMERSAITHADIMESIERVVAGLEKKSRRLQPDEKRTVAYHEVGHAICAAASPRADPVKKISIIPRGIAALGYTMQLPLEDRYLLSKAELLNRITILFGGRAAEELVFGDITTGAHDDIRKASDLARRMVTQYGMSPRVGAIHYVSEGPASPLGLGPSMQLNASPRTAEAIEAEVRHLIDRCYQRAVEILQRNRAVLEEMSLHLLEQEVLEGDAMDRFLKQIQMADDLADPPTGEAWPHAAD